VFVLQVAGEKRWLVYEPVLALPLKNQRYTAELGGPGEAVLDITLGAGDTLYLPRGWLHEALTSDSDALHVTVGVNVYTWLDAVRAALDECAAEEVDYRRSAADDGVPADELLQLLGDRLGREEVARRRRERFVASRRPIRGDQFNQLRGLGRLDADTPLERSDTVVFDFTADEEHVTLAFEGRRLSFPVHACEEVEAVARAKSRFRAADLPGDLDEESRLVLVRRLVREGFLRLSAP
jgi:hypothetical protein